MNEELNKSKTFDEIFIKKKGSFLFIRDENNNELNEDDSITLSRKVRIFIFILFLFLSIVVDLDNGIFNSSVKYIMNDLNMNTTEYGLFASISFTGRIIGLIIFMVIINFKHRKFTLILTIILHGSSYFIFQISNNRYLLTFAKMFGAANKVCANVYRPVWIEQFGLSHYKSIFFSLVQIMSSYGQIIGFNLGSLYFEENWKTPLIYILALMYLIAICFMLIPGKYFHRNIIYYGEKTAASMDKNDNLDTNQEINNDTNKKTIIDRTTLFVSSVKSEKKNKGFKNSLKDICSLLKNKIFLSCIIKRSNVTFIFQIIHSYLKIYQENILEDSNNDLITLFYNISSLLSTTIGGLLGGIIAKKLGGYEKKKSIFVVIIAEIFTSINIFFLAFTSNFYIYNINLMLFFCFVTMDTPVIQGYLIKTIPKSIKGVGIGFDMIVSTFLGKIPGPLVYGILEDKYSKENPSLAWKICLCYFYVGFIVVILLCIFKCFEKIQENASEVKFEDHIVNIAAISSGSDSNDMFRIEMELPKRSHSVHKTVKKDIALELSNNENDNDNDIYLTIL